MKVEGNTGAYTTGTQGRPIPMGDRPRKATPPPRRSTGLNWDALRPAGEPAHPVTTLKPKRKRCTGCGNPTPAAELRSDQCPVCVAATEARFHAPLDSDLAVLELTDPAVAAAAAALDEATDRIVNRDAYAHPEPPKAATQGNPTTRTGAPRANQTRSTTGRARRAVASRPSHPKLAGTSAARTGVIIKISDVVDAYQAGRTPPQIAAEHHTTAKRIRGILDRAGVERRDDRATHSGGRNNKTAVDDPPEIVAEVRRLYLDHQLPQLQVAEALGLGLKAVQNLMARQGIPVRPPACERSVIPAADIPELARRYQAGESTTDIAATYGVDATAIRKRLLKAGVKLRSRSEAIRLRRERMSNGGG